MTDPSSRAPSVWPAFQAHDPRAVITFLVALGFEETACYADEDGVVQHCQLDWPEGGGVMFGSVKDHDLSRPPGSAGFYVVTADPRAVHERAVAAGARITREPENPDYAGPDGWEFSLEDPEGNAWSFGTYPGEPRSVG